MSSKISDNTVFFAAITSLGANVQKVEQGWGTCGPREHLTWPASEFSLVKLSKSSHQNKAQ